MTERRLASCPIQNWSIENVGERLAEPNLSGIEHPTACAAALGSTVSHLIHSDRCCSARANDEPPSLPTAGYCTPAGMAPTKPERASPP